MTKEKKIYPLGQHVHVDYLLASTLEDVTDIECIALVTIDKKGHAQVSYSDCSRAELALMAVSLQAAAVKRLSER